MVPGSFSLGSEVLAATTTSQPSSASRNANVLPTPREAPVTKATRPTSGADGDGGEDDGATGSIGPRYSGRLDATIPRAGAAEPRRGRAALRHPTVTEPSTLGNATIRRFWRVKGVDSPAVPPTFLGSTAF